MITKRTVLVLGAGASKEYEFPLGFKLIENIIGSLVNTPGDHFRQILACGIESHHVTDFADKLKGSQQNSIDYFLNHQSQFSEVGKLAIAQALLPLEKDIRLLPHRLHLYRHIINAMECKESDFKDNQLSVITFNYERSFERFLQLCLQSRYPIDEKRANELASSVPVYHIHGSLGALPGFTYKHAPSLQTIPYGCSDMGALRKAAESIRTVHEDHHPGDRTIYEAQEALLNADRVFFLGLAYDELNLSRLNVKRTCAYANVVGTSHRLSSSDCARTETLFDPAKISLQDCTALEAFGTWGLE